MPPEHPADETDGDSRPDDPHGATPSDEPGATLEVGSILADADANVSESEVEIKARNAGPDATDATAPSAH
jgi:hypothetical protein